MTVQSEQEMIEIEFLEEPSRERVRIPINEVTRKIGMDCGVVINGESYRVQGLGGGNGGVFSTISVSTAEFYRRTSGVLKTNGVEDPDLHISYDVTEFIV